MDGGKQGWGVKIKNVVDEVDKELGQGGSPRYRGCHQNSAAFGDQSDLGCQGEGQNKGLSLLAMGAPGLSRSRFSGILSFLEHS